MPKTKNTRPSAAAAKTPAPQKAAAAPAPAATPAKAKAKAVASPVKAEVAAAPVVAAPVAAPVSAPKPAVEAAPAKTSSIHFHIHPELPAIRGYAQAQGWSNQELSFPWRELVYTTDGWKTAKRVRTEEPPSPTNGAFLLPDVPAGVEVEFAIRVGLASRAPEASSTAEGELWLNNDGQNFRQQTH